MIDFVILDWTERDCGYSGLLVENFDRGRAGACGLYHFHNDAEVDRRTYGLDFHYRSRSWPKFL